MRNQLFMKKESKGEYGGEQGVPVATLHRYASAGFASRSGPGSMLQFGTHS